MEDIQLYTVSEIAQILKLDPFTIRRYIKDKKLKAAKVGRGYRISRQDFELFYKQMGGNTITDEEES